MHVNEFHIDETLIRKSLLNNSPIGPTPLKSVSSAETDNALYRLGHDMVVRLPHINWAVEGLDKEFFWFPKTASFLPVAIPASISKRAPMKDYPWP